MRGELVPPEFYDRALQLRDEYRSTLEATAGAKASEESR
jgi:hypothetical protein